MAPPSVDLLTSESLDSAPVNPAKQNSIQNAAPRSFKPTDASANTLPGPLKLTKDSPILQYEHRDSTVPVGTEFPRGSIELVDLLNAPNRAELFRDLAALISQRGVVFFRAQHITAEQLIEATNELGVQSGKPKTSKLHIHPYTPIESALGDEILPITSNVREVPVTETKIINQLPPRKTNLFDIERRASSEWHTDITYEPIPSDYSALKIHTHTAGVGGDTLWASGYELYDRLSPRYRQLLDGLYALHDGYSLNEYNARYGYGIRNYRGAPENSGQDVSPIHPLIRTNPVTGWKSVFFNQLFVNRILGVSQAESKSIIEYLHRLVTDSPDLQVRYRWEQYPDDPEAHDVAIWDNRSSLHTAIDDFFEIGGTRIGDRAVSLGEKPYFDPNSKSRREDLGGKLWQGQPNHEKVLRELRGW
ncbi:TauD-domain-containing protein [Ascobolus immersus RN42]|uniref:TauD-domain-containing protein n=1 Tax=Ascobolus immersus RN42 TaxID=1160509 RepID=A0A3N4IHB3_ASCIM|nr:TauD-domain-containing protein [Ascobolus immersus RN42]